MTRWNVKYTTWNVFYKENLSKLSIDNACYCIALLEIKSFYLIIKLLCDVRPGARIWAYHITSMPDAFILKCVFIFTDNIFMSHTDSYPIWCAFIYFKFKCRNLCNCTNCRFHQNCLIRLTFFRNSSIRIWNPNLWTFKFIRKFKNFTSEYIFNI